MVKINELSAVNSVALSDSIPLYSVSNGDARRTTVQNIHGVTGFNDLDALEFVHTDAAGKLITSLNVTPGVVTASGATESRALSARFSESANALDYGARGNGAVDDSAAINAAIATGKPVYLPPGQYRVDAPIVLGSGARLFGAGSKTVIIVPDVGFVGERAITNSGYDAAGNTDIVIADFAVRVTASPPMGGADPGIIRMQRVDGLTISGLTTEVYDSNYSTIDLAGGCSNVLISGCRLENVHAVGDGTVCMIRGGRVADATLNCHGVSVVGNVFKSALDESLSIYGWMNTIDGISISGNVLINEGPNRIALGIVGYNWPGQTGIVQDVSVSGNTIRGKTNIVTGAYRVSMVGNSIIGPTAGAKDAIMISEYGAGAARPEDVSVVGNEIFGAAGHGIYDTGARTVISGNKVIGTTGNGIYSDNPTSSAYVVGNIVQDCGSANIYVGCGGVIARNKLTGSTTGIQVFTHSELRLSIDGNEIIDAATSGISLNSAGGNLTGAEVLRNAILGLTVATTYGVRCVGGGYVSCVSDFNRISGVTTPYVFLGTWSTQHEHADYEEIYDRVSYLPTAAAIPTAGTNLHTWSEAFSNAAWTKSGSTIVDDAIAAPDGTVTADKLMDAVAGGLVTIHGVSESISCTEDDTYTMSIYAQLAAGEWSRIALTAHGAFTTDPEAGFNLNTGAVIWSYNNAGSSITNIGGGWYRLSMSFVAESTNVVSCYYELVNDAGQRLFVGDGTKGAYIWGAQAEFGARMADYAKTETVAAATLHPTFLGTGTPTAATLLRGDGSWGADAVALADSVAVDVPGLRADFNTLLANLRAARIMET